ncbi:hypothetical protein NQK81_27865 [Amycolatopsis roodepoortensis]|uniref:hypothetical protein n=1 Tax=Amycolatopsis roodepoortensis TaxID=700274 RepID=UPI00214C447C|nr:hypothetical protein [Amycolatopsis roodepoortensis]UUV28594.1 hypothetical protein NQK81_27865 [Amycolatopsis roodepoortensis]
MTTTEHVDTPAPPPAPAPVVMIGDSYDGTVELSLREIAARIREDLVVVQDDDMIHADAEFAVVADESGPQNQIHITISGLPHSDHGTADTPSMDVTRDVFRSAFVLASHYNTFVSSPYRLRYLVVIQAVHDSGTVYAEGVGAIGLWGTLSQPETAEAPLRHG